MSDSFESVEWDPKKSEANERLRGFDFEFAALAFRGDWLEEESTRDVGERRFVSIGAVYGLVLAVVWTPRGTVRRIISARRASRKERVRYYAYRSQEAL